MNALRNGWTRLCEAFGPSSDPSLSPPAPPIWVAGVEFSGNISCQDASTMGLDEDSAFPSMTEPARSPADFPYTTAAYPAAAVPPAPGAATVSASASASASEEYPSSKRPMTKFIDIAHATVWCTYRSNFLPLARHNITSDAGWGCMLRSGQMLMCNALLEHCLGRSWRTEAQVPNHDPYDHNSIVDAVDRSFPNSEVARSVLLLFLDHPNYPFSVHSITALGAQYGVRPGDWFAPTPISLVLRDLCMRYQPAKLRAYCARDGAIYTNELVDMLGTAPCARGASPSENTCIDLSKETHQIPQSAAETNNAFIVLIPVRLGINSINQAYFQKINALFQVPEFIGITGGRPHSSLFFFAAQGNELYYLNPHYVQPSVAWPSTTASLPLHSFVPSRVKKVPISTLDPSMSLGFLFRSMVHFSDFQRRFTRNDDINDLFSIIDGRPDRSGFESRVPKDSGGSILVDI